MIKANKLKKSQRIILKDGESYILEIRFWIILTILWTGEKQPDSL